MKKTFRLVVSFAFVLAIASVPFVSLADFNIDVVRHDAIGFGVSTSTPSSILTNIINYALAIIGFLGILGFAISGIMYLVSAGDEKATSTAKSYMVSSIIGVIVALLGFVIMNAVSTLLGAGNATEGL